MRKPLIAGNWKMHGRKADLAELAALGERVGQAARSLDVLICPPAVYLEAAALAAKGGPILVGAQ
ncbi:MAG: triose-phosphate isomerase, partial [Hyphomonadaceae bacterium]